MEEVKIQVRMPEQTREMLVQLADADKRSMNSQMLWLIEREFDRRRDLPRFLVDREIAPDYAITLEG